MYFFLSSQVKNKKKTLCLDQFKKKALRFVSRLFTIIMNSRPAAKKLKLRHNPFVDVSANRDYNDDSDQDSDQDSFGPKREIVRKTITKTAKKTVIDDDDEPDLSDEGEPDVEGLVNDNDDEASVSTSTSIHFSTNPGKFGKNFMELKVRSRPVSKRHSNRQEDQDLDEILNVENEMLAERNIETMGNKSQSSEGNFSYNNRSDGDNDDDDTGSHASQQTNNELINRGQHPVLLFAHMIKWMQGVGDDTSYTYSFDYILKIVQDYAGIIFDFAQMGIDMIVWTCIVQVACVCGKWTMREEVFDEAKERILLENLTLDDVEKWFGFMKETMFLIEVKIDPFKSERPLEPVLYITKACVELLKSFEARFRSSFHPSLSEMVSNFKSNPQYFQNTAVTQFMKDAPKGQPYSRFLAEIMEILMHTKARILGDSVFVPVFHNGQKTFAFRRHSSISEFVHAQFSFVKNVHLLELTMQGVHIPKNAIEYIETHPEPVHCPRLVQNRTCWSFNDCIYDGTTDEFLKYGSTDIPDDLVTAKFINQDVYSVLMEDDQEKYQDYLDIPTPILDKFLHYQFRKNNSTAVEKEEEIQVERFFLAMIGRLFRNLGSSDCFQVAPFIIGVAGSGKSQIINQVQRVYEAGLTGIVQSDIQEKFGLESLMGKYVITSCETSKKSMINQQLFQSMVSGEAMAINKKNHITENLPAWQIPILMAMNKFPATWQDNSCSLFRRIVCFYFRNPPIKKDPSMEKNFPNELAMFIIKCNKAYLDIVNRSLGSNKSLDDIMPQTLSANRDELMEVMNPLMRALNSNELFEYDSSENPSYRCEFNVAKRAITDFLKQTDNVVVRDLDEDSLSAYFATFNVVTSKQIEVQAGRRVTRTVFIGVRIKEATQ